MSTVLLTLAIVLPNWMELFFHRTPDAGDGSAEGFRSVMGRNFSADVCTIRLRVEKTSTASPIRIAVDRGILECPKKPKKTPRKGKPMAKEHENRPHESHRDHEGHEHREHGRNEPYDDPAEHLEIENLRFTGGLPPTSRSSTQAASSGTDCPDLSFGRQWIQSSVTVIPTLRPTGYP